MSPEPIPPFAERVSLAMSREGFTLRSFCRAVRVDPSFFSKVLSGKRSPPAEEDVLRRIAEVLHLDAAELIVSAGRIPSEWRALWKDASLFRSVNSLARQAPERRPPPSPAAPRPRAPAVAARQDLAAELL